MQRFLNNRGVKWLLHFTRAVNLPSILEEGLLPRSILEEHGLSFWYNDEFRHDRCKSAVCTSIEFPNYKMFFSLRQRNQADKWVVLVLDARIILDFDCAFCSKNAGDASMFTIDIEERKGIIALKKLFEETTTGPSRKKLGIPERYPTNPQAEVLVFDVIPPSYIKEVLFMDETTLSQYREMLPVSVAGSVNRHAFDARADYEYWR